MACKYLAYIVLSLYFGVLHAAGKHVQVKPNDYTNSSLKDCYTLSHIVQNPTEYFVSDTTMEFMPGHHIANFTDIVLVTNIANIALLGSDPKSVIQCNQEFGGFAFINVTNLTIEKLELSHCGAPMPYTYILAMYNCTTTLETELYRKIGEVAYFLHSHPAIGLVQVYNITISEIDVHDTMGAGLLGINILGHSIISQSNFTKNYPNCQIGYVAPLVHNSHTLLSIERSKFAFGTALSGYTRQAGGLSILFSKTNYSIHVNISNIEAYGNRGRSKQFGNLLFEFYRCNHIILHLNRVNCTKGESDSPTVLTLRRQVILTEDSCSTQPTKECLMYISNSHFTAGSEITMYMDSRGTVKLENVTILASVNNSAVRIISMNNVASVVMTNVSLIQNQGTPFFVQNSNITFEGDSYFTENSGFWGALALHRSTATFKGNNTFLRNTGRRSGALYAEASTLILQGNMQFIENEGYSGGALALHDGSQIVLDQYLYGRFLRNHAYYYGGAIYVQDMLEYLSFLNIEALHCFYKPNGGKLYFENNTADIAGSELYGGWVNSCSASLLGWRTYNFTDIFHLTRNSTDPSLISSSPSRVCLCTNSTPNCSITHYNIATVYPGETFQIQTVTVGQLSGITPGTVNTEILSGDSNTHPQLETLQYVQNTGKICTNLSYTLKSRNNKEILLLTTTAKRELDFLPQVAIKSFRHLQIHIKLKGCPSGFRLDSDSSCTCHPWLQKHSIPCYINTQKVYRESQLWITFVPRKNALNSVIVHEHCPFDYCRPRSINLSLDYPDEQCAFHRSGVLCGACQRGLSHVLGSSSCKECSQLWLLLMATFMLIGAALTALLILLNLTVAVGTINGLIFYANIVRANHAIFFPPSVSNSFLSWFIAWLNLDLGIKTCFYDGLDAYAKTWLQFVFPLYIWLIVFLIIVLSHYYTTAARLSGRNAVPVLATLFLFSYAKLLRITIIIFQSTILEYSDGSVQRVWLYDGNVDFLKGKHIPLFIVALLLSLLLALPYTAVLLFIQCLQQRSKYRVLSWIWKLKPLFDAYTGPYKDKHRYWTGLLLFLRVLLFAVFSVNVQGDPAINLLAITVTITCLLIYTSFLWGIYKKIVSGRNRVLILP